MQKSTKHMSTRSGKEHGFLLIELAIAFTLMVLGISLLTSFYYFCEHTNHSILTYFEKITVLHSALRFQIWPDSVKTSVDAIEIRPLQCSLNYYSIFAAQLPSFVAYIPPIKLVEGIISWQDRTKKQHALKLVIGQTS